MDVTSAFSKVQDECPIRYYSISFMTNATGVLTNINNAGITNSGIITIKNFPEPLEKVNMYV